MRRLARIGRAVWEFVVGDDWITAAGVTVAIGVTAVVAAAGAASWWIMPIAVIGLLASSLRRAAGAVSSAGRFRS
jgi:hypothetical protein